MTQCCDLVSNIGIAACASVGGVTSLGAGGCGHNCVVLVAQCCNLFHGGLTADSTGGSHGTILGAGCCNSNSLVIMAAV